MLAVIASDRTQVSADAFASDERERGLAKGPLFLSLSLSLKKKHFHTRQMPQKPQYHEASHLRGLYKDTVCFCDGDLLYAHPHSVFFLFFFFFIESSFCVVFLF